LSSDEDESSSSDFSLDDEEPILGWPPDFSGLSFISSFLGLSEAVFLDPKGGAVKNISLI